jgi:uncharacterized membrane protein
MYWIEPVLSALIGSGFWMAWNLILALLPLALSVWLFRLASKRSPLWWAGMLAFVAFLPNAPYVLTDLIHLVQEIQENDSLFLNTLVVIPKYVLFELIGVEAYVLALINLGYYLKREGLGRYILQTELVLHGLSAIGVYLGRFDRFNSWDLVINLHRVLHNVVGSLLDERPLILITIGFVGITGLYWVLKQITLALILQREYLKTLQRLSEQGQSPNLRF